MKVLERIWGTQVGDRLEKCIAGEREEECRNKEVGVGQWGLLSEVRCIVVLQQVSEEGPGVVCTWWSYSPGTGGLGITHRLGVGEG